MSRSSQSMSVSEPEERSSEGSITPYVPSSPNPGEEGSDSNGPDQPTLATLAADLRCCENHFVLWADKQLEMDRLYNRRVGELEAQVRALTARVNAPPQHPLGTSNEELDERVDHLEHLHHTYAANVDHDLAGVTVQIALLQMAVDGLQAAQAAAQAPPPPPPAAAASDDDDADSDVSDAMEP